MRFSDGVATALRVSGTSAGEASGALTQLGQLLGSARVQAEEFNSVNEGARPILIAVANGLDKAGGSVNKLKQLVNDGEVSGRAFFEAFLKGLPSVQAMAGNASQTIDQALTRINNAFTRYIGQTDESLGATQRLVAGLNALADNFDAAADTAVQFATIIGAGLLGRGIGSMIGSLGNAVTVIGGVITALRAGTLSMAGFSAALGPLGLIAGVAAAALVTFSTRMSEAEQAAHTHEAAIKELSYQIETLDYANSLSVASTRSKIALDIEAAKAALTRAQAERELAAAIAKDAVDPSMSLLPAPAASDVGNTVQNDPLVQDRQALIDQINKQIDDLAKAQTTFEDYASARSARIDRPQIREMAGLPLPQQALERSPRGVRNNPSTKARLTRSGSALRLSSRKLPRKAS